MIKLFVAFLFCCFCIPGLTQPEKNVWVDSVFNALNEDEKIGQLFMVSVSSAANDNDLNRIERGIQTDKIGGIVFTTGHPRKQVELTNRYQSNTSVPLLIAMDAVSGPGTLLDSMVRYPPTIAMGALESDSLLYELSRQIGKQLQMLGVNMNLAPTANLLDAAVSDRHNFFGEDRYTVTRRALTYMQGMRSVGILSCAKHFPIQGITIKDIQKDIPVIHPFVDSIQAYPFQQLFKEGIDAVMPAANELPLFYEKKKAARRNTLSGSMLASFFAGDWIKRQMDYKGLVIVDIRVLEGASKKLKNRNAEVFAFQAGNDILLTDNNPGPAIRQIRRLIRKEKQYADQLDNSVRKILAAKYDAGLAVRKSIDTENLLLRLNDQKARVLEQISFKAIPTIVRNASRALPLLTLENKKFASVIVGDSVNLNVFSRLVSRYVPTTKSYVHNRNIDAFQSVVNQHDCIILAISPRATQELLQRVVSALQSARPDQQVIAVDFGCPVFQPFANKFNTVVEAYIDQPQMVRAVPQIIFGAIPSKGVLPFMIAGNSVGTGIKTQSLRRLEFSIPERVGVSSQTLKRIESIANEAINMGATPGCYVLVAKEGQIIYDKAFGHYTYEKQMPVTDSTIYDLASLTKVTATLQAVMFMHDRKLIDLNKKASVYLPELKTTNKKDFTLKDILTHQAGLWPFLLYWPMTVDKTGFLPEYYDTKPSLKYSYVVADNLYTTSAMRDSLWSWTIKSKVREKVARTPYDFRYSDMGFYISKELSERILNQPIEDFLSQNLYEPLGAHTTGYLPLTKFPAMRIAPTENDTIFRKALLIGTVHDEGAAMFGGVSGHAGLFSSANDLAKLGQMLLQDGYYGGYQYYKPETVRLFSAKQFETSRRGLGWDKPVQSDFNSPTSILASPKTYGHTGFTGTCIWIDPEFNLLYIFLSNRVHPYRNNKLLNANIRSRIQDTIYQAIFDYCKSSEDRILLEKDFNSASNGR
jgi:beta-N-acetylhexosaminidase